jgi:hypothetical protein
VSDGAWWDSSHACYAAVVSSDPNDPAHRETWEHEASIGHTGGVLKQCKASPYSDGGRYQLTWWAPDADPAPTTQELEDAARWLLEGTIVAPELGVWPGELGTDESLWPGAVGMPAWFWSKDPGPGVGAPDTKTTTVKGYTVRATAFLVETVWDTGDDEAKPRIVTCGLGVEPVNVRHVKPAPTGCGHTYMKRGDYTITATTHVRVDWSGAGRSGSIPVTVSRSAVYHVGEIQVLGVNVPR